MTRLYSSKAQTRRWPVHVFFNILNIAVINSWVLYKEVNNSNIPRRNFIVQLVEELLEQTESFCISQSTQSNAQSSTPRTPTVRKRLESIDMNSAKSTPPKKTCSNDDKKKGQIRSFNQNKTNVTCFSCKKYCCGPCCNEQKITVLCQKSFEEGKRF